jgi:hypothetical protein
MSDRAVEQISVAMMLSVVAIAVAWSVGVVAANIRRSLGAKRVAALHASVLDRFSTSGELIGYLESPAARRFIESLVVDTRDVTHRILAAAQFGIALTLLGLSLLTVRAMEDQPAPRRTFLWLGLPMTSVGVGLLVSAALSRRLARSWGLLKPGRPPLE